MGAYEDILSGKISLPSAAAGGSSGFDFSGLLGSAISAGASVFQTISAAKQSKGMVKALIGAGGGLPKLPTLGTGAMAFPSGIQPADFNLGPRGLAITRPGDSMDMGGGSGMGRGGPVYLCYTTPSGRSAVSGYRSLGHPMLWSGDFQAVKRVARVRRKLGAGHHRPR